MSKKYIIKIDTETSGLDSSVDQILTCAYKIKDEQDNEVEKAEFRVKLKSGVRPSPMALAVNKINPFSKEWDDNSITEYDLVNKLKSTLSKYATKDEKGRDLKPQLEAYNIPFDKAFLSIAMARSGVKLSDYASKSSIDPLKSVRKLISRYEDDIKKGKDNPNKSFFEGLRKNSSAAGGKNRGSDFSAKLEDVARSLGIKYEGTGAHTAASDVEVLDQVGKAIFKMSTGKDRTQSMVDPSTFQEGEVYHITSDSASSGIKNRHVRVIKNDFEKGQIVVLDEDDIKKNGELKDSAVRTFNYDTVVGLNGKTSQAEISLNAYYQTQRAQIDQWAESAGMKGRKQDDIFDEDTKHFGLIQSVSDDMVKSKNKREAFDKNYAQLTEKFNGDKLSAKSVMTKAERLAEAQGKNGWSEDLFPIKRIAVLEHSVADSTLKLSLDPSGNYKVYLTYNKNGEIYNNEGSIKGKPELKKFLKEYLGSVNGYEDFISDIPSSAEFKDNKNSAALLTDLQAALERARGDDQAETALSALITHLKEKDPLAFDKVKAPREVVNYKPQEGEVTSEASTSAIAPAQKPMSTSQAMKNNKVMPDAVDGHVDSTESSGNGKIPCALCGRGLSAAVSKAFYMGKTCRDKAEFVDNSTEPIETFVNEVQPLSQVKKVSSGDLYAVQYKDYTGESRTMYCVTLSVGKDNLKVLDRRKLQSMIKAGEDPALSVYTSMIKIAKTDIEGLGRISSDKVDQAIKKVA
jgi:hypothetical protein